uniref:ORF30 n=1 Tax=Nitrosopumilaceae spindle-shaped virus TaxID=3065433 RepID=A0AAT9J9S6_9VIRU
MDESLTWYEPQTPNQIMDEVIEKYGYDRFYVLFSGGKDSVCVADFISKNYPDRFAGIVYTNTGLGSQATRKFVVDYAKKRGWKIHMTWASEKERFYNIVLKYGFAFAGNHSMWMGYLKMHTWYYFLYPKIKSGENACFISGVRKKESRMRNKIKQYTKKPLDFNSGLPYVKPFLYKNGSQIWDYFIDNDLEKTPVYEWLNRSGECYCGAHAEEWDLKLLEKYDTLAFNTIKWLEKQIELYGSPLAKRYNKWGYKSSTKDISDQKTFDDFLKDGIEVNEDYCGESCMI